MVRRWSIEDFRDLSVEERLRLVEELWESIAETPEALPPLTEAQRKELDRRLEDHRCNPASALPWEVVKADILNRLRTTK